MTDEVRRALSGTGRTGVYTTACPIIDALGQPAGFASKSSQTGLLQRSQPPGQLLRQIHLDSARSPCTPRTGQQHTDTPMQPPAGPGHAQREPQLSPQPPSPSPMVRFPLAPGEGLNTSFADGTFTCPERPLTPQCGRPLIPSRQAQPHRVPQQRQLRTPNPQETRASLISISPSTSYTTPPQYTCTHARAKAQVRQPGHHRPPPSNPEGAAT